MTELDAAPPLRKRGSTRRLTATIATFAAGASLLLGAGLSWELARGADPALGPKAAVSQGVPPRRIVKTVVIRRVVGSSSSGSSLPSSTPAPAPVAAAPAPVSTATS